MEQNSQETEIASQMDEDDTEVATGNADTMSMEVMDTEKEIHASTQEELNDLTQKVVSRT
jgi:hypothetical protein